jgi:putative spermidine/putrescine transport system permease protein
LPEFFEGTRHAFCHRRGSGLGLALPAILLLLAFFVVPVAALLTRSVTEPEWGLQNYVTLLGSST